LDGKTLWVQVKSKAKHKTKTNKKKTQTKKPKNPNPPQRRNDSVLGGPKVLTIAFRRYTIQIYILFLRRGVQLNVISTNLLILFNTIMIYEIMVDLRKCPITT
jgi:hypothetical protein